MSSRRNKKSILPDLIFSKFFLVLFLFLFLAVLFSLAKGTIKNYKVHSEIEDLQQEIVHLERQNQEFNQLIQYLQTDSFVEQEAKLKFGYKKSGENLVIIPQNEIFEESSVPEDSRQQLSNPAKWWTYFFN